MTFKEKKRKKEEDLGLLNRQILRYMEGEKKKKKKKNEMTYANANLLYN